jgi:hypothetical protein
MREYKKVSYGEKGLNSHRACDGGVEQAMLSISFDVVGG